MATAGSGDKLAALRSLMKDRQLDAYVVPSEDAHASEYIAPADARRAYLSNFTGSAGRAIVTKDAALLWTDGRYFLQAEKELGKDWTLMKGGLPDVPSWTDWLESDLPSGSRIGIDPALALHSEISSLCKDLFKKSSKSSSTVVPVKENLVDLVWASQPPRPANSVIRLDDRYAGESVAQKLKRMREKLRKIGSPGTVLSQLDEVAWLFNLRGSDIPFNPVFFSYVILSLEDCNLFMNPTSIDESVREYLHTNGVSVLEYGQFWNRLGSFGEEVKAVSDQPLSLHTEDVKAGLNGNGANSKSTELPEKIVKTTKIIVGEKTSWAVVQVLGEDEVDVRGSIVEDAKARKNSTEIDGFRQCHIRDGAALCRYFSWLEQVLQKGEKWSEHDAAQVLENYRRQNELFMGLSFSTISSTGPNAAIIHYFPPEEGSDIIDINQVYLCDSGAQYLDGTTDTTRTWHFGNPSEEETRAFTRVLQGNIGEYQPVNLCLFIIALDTLVFPQGTSGYRIDAVARRSLWSDGLDYRHGTGHGVGSFLNVHEGPFGIGLRKTLDTTPLQAGHVVSNEPGYYADGKFGIRIENIDIVKLAETRDNFGGKGYLTMENVTMVPIQTKMIQQDLLLPPERTWLNEYHQDVKEKITPLLEKFEDERALAWLERECAPI